jgi:hypothetical protein
MYVLIEGQRGSVHEGLCNIQGLHYGPDGFLVSCRTHRIDLASTEKENLEFVPYSAIIVQCVNYCYFNRYNIRVQHLK